MDTSWAIKSACNDGETLSTTAKFQSLENTGKDKKSCSLNDYRI
jgi:hypothetical protein